MKSVTFSEIERIQQGARPLSIVQSSQGFATFGLSLVLGLPALVMAFHLFDPTAPLGYIVLPILLGIVLPIVRALPGRFQVATRFSACHLIGTLDASLESLGYAPAERGPGTLRYRARGARFAHWEVRDVAVTVCDHTLEVVGPVRTLRALRRQMAC